MGIDWNAIKTEYITTDTSFRKLSEKYGVHKDTIHRKAKEERWADSRRQQIDITQTKMLEDAAEKEVSRVSRLLDASDQLMDKVVEYMETMRFTGFRDTQAMKHLSGVLKDLKDIQMIRSEADLREQEARINSLNRQAQKDSDSKDITVEMSTELEELSG